MSLLLKTFSVVFPVFAVIGLGYAFAGFKKINLGPVIDILLYLTIPALVISSLSKIALDAGLLVTVALSAGVVVASTGLMARAYLTLAGKKRLRGFYLPVMFMNTGNMGFPLALLAFGPEGLAVAVIYYIIVGILVYSVGIYIAKGSGGFGEMFRLPLIYASCLAVILNLLHIELPGPLVTTFDMLGAATIPLMQLSLGYRLYSVSITHLSTSAAGTVIRMAGGFIVSLIIVKAAGIGGLTAKIIILSSSMPSAVINFIVSHKYEVQSDLVASTVAMSTALSILTVPLLLMWLMG